MPSMTEFASDPKTPVSRAEIERIIAMQSRLPCLTLNAGQLPAALATAGEESGVDCRRTGRQPSGPVIDAVAPHVRETLLVGSAGLCEALARRPQPRRLGAHRAACRRHGAGGGAVFPARCIFPAAMWPSPSRTRSAPQGFRSAAGWRSAFHTGISRRPLVAAGDDQSRRIRHRHHAVTCCEFY